jgi:hypothetical protein
MRPPAADPGLWHRVQRIVYPRHQPSNGPPFTREQCEPTPRRKPASWLYWKLLDDPGLRAQVLSRA